MTTGIYQINNCAADKCYIGSAVNIEKRCYEHQRTLKLGTHHSILLQRSWNKYGAGAFSFRPLLICATEDLLLYEQRCLDAFCPAYNICRIAGSSLGVKRSPAQIESIAAKLRGQKRGPQSVEHRAKLGAAHKGKKRLPFSSAWRKHLSEAIRGKSRPPLTAEHREKLRVATIAYYARQRTGAR